MHLLSVRTLLEVESARLAAKHATPEHIKELRKIQKDGENAVEADDEEALVAANTALHAFMVSISGNTVLAGMIASVERRPLVLHTPGKDAQKPHVGGTCGNHRCDHQWRRASSPVADAPPCGPNTTGYLQIVRNGEEQVRH